MAKFVPYRDENGLQHMFDAERVMFTMSHPIFGDDGSPAKFIVKVAMDTNMGFILADEPLEDVISRIENALASEAA